MSQSINSCLCNTFLTVCKSLHQCVPFRQCYVQDKTITNYCIRSCKPISKGFAKRLAYIAQLQVTRQETAMPHLDDAAVRCHHVTQVAKHLRRANAIVNSQAAPCKTCMTQIQLDPLHVVVVGTLALPGRQWANHQATVACVPI